jgi:hypothetical protein
MIMVYAEQRPDWAALQFAGNSYFNSNVQVAGDITAASCCGASDLRLKRDIAPLSNSLDKVLGLSGVEFRWDEEPENDAWKAPDSSTHIGLVAQDVEKVLPEVVHTDGRGYKSVEYDKLTALLVEALKEQQKQIQKQAERIEALERQQGPYSREH